MDPNLLKIIDQLVILNYTLTSFKNKTQDVQTETRGKLDKVERQNRQSPLQRHNPHPWGKVFLLVDKSSLRNDFRDNCNDFNNLRNDYLYHTNRDDSRSPNRWPKYRGDNFDPDERYLKSIKIDAPSFDGHPDPQYFLDWIRGMDNYFMWYNMSDARFDLLV